MNGMSLFSGAGIGEFYLSRIGINIVVANEIISKRAKLYQNIYPNTSMIMGDIRNPDIFKKIVKIALKNDVDYLIASPPCQGISIAGKNRRIHEMANDSRNYLIKYVVEMIKVVKPKFILIENVPRLLKMQLYIEEGFKTVEDILEEEFKDMYDIDYRVLDASDYEVPQIRKRAIIRLKQKGLIWQLPEKTNKKKTVKDAIGDLPSIESGEISHIKWHFGRVHSEDHILWMKHTPTGATAFENEVFFPHKKDGTKIKGYNTTYRRMNWNQPAPTITIRNDAISSQRNVHPGRPLKDGTYSDSRVLSILELMRLTTLPDDWPIRDETEELLIRQVIGESIPPLFVEKISKGILSNEN
ncbi:DNA cytosine methyltransferase [Veillonella montpellierensis]|uniref:DNA cytosine methyltransferase n=1 Tax=Veillonella montpellierensis TaxID=187328 RepID=UPI0023F813D7|nr:DNA (cytosine-5-)-methyltransferase [Veillonella montpellierensis]